MLLLRVCCTQISVFFRSHTVALKQQGNMLYWEHSVYSPSDYVTLICLRIGLCGCVSVRKKELPFSPPEKDAPYMTYESISHILPHAMYALLLDVPLSLLSSFLWIFSLPTSLNIIFYTDPFMHCIWFSWFVFVFPFYMSTSSGRVHEIWNTTSEPHNLRLRQQIPIILPLMCHHNVNLKLNNEYVVKVQTQS